MWLKLNSLQSPQNIINISRDKIEIFSRHYKPLKH